MPPLFSRRSFTLQILLLALGSMAENGIVLLLSALTLNDIISASSTHGETLVPFACCLSPTHDCSLRYRSDNDLFSNKRCSAIL